MKKQHLTLVVGFLALVNPATVFAQSLGLNFAALDPDAATSSLNPTDVAGVVPAANWNNLDGASGSASGLVYNNAGAPVASTVSVTWTSPNTWRSGANSAFPAGPNRVLLSGYIDTGNTTETGITLTVDNIDAALRSPLYDVYVYFLGDNAEQRGGGYTIDDGTQTILKYGSSMGSPSTFVEDPGTDVDNNVDGNYLRFRALSGSSFTLTTDTTLTTPNGFRAPVNAIQIVGGVRPVPGPGDVNEDGATNLVDYGIIRDNFFKTTGVSRTLGDLNVDGRVDLADYSIWRNLVPPQMAASTGVPEPASLALAFGAVAAFAAATRRVRRGAGATR